MAQATCLIEGCQLPIRDKKRGWCNKHYQRWWNHGNPLTILNNRGLTAEQRFFLKVTKQADGCWIWTGNITRKGYGLFHAGHGKRMGATHRWAYEHWIGPIPEGLQLDHLCRVRACVNPQHVEPVTAKENQTRSPFDPAQRTHCPQGHPYDEQNTYRMDDRHRQCRKCHREACRRYDARQKAARCD